MRLGASRTSRGVPSLTHAAVLQAMTRSPRASTSSRLWVTYRMGILRAAFQARRSSTIEDFSSASRPVSGSSSSKHAWQSDERSRQGDALLFPTGDFGRLAGAEFFDAEGLQDFSDARVALVWRQTRPVRRPRFLRRSCAETAPGTETRRRCAGAAAAGLHLRSRIKQHFAADRNAARVGPHVIPRCNPAAWIFRRRMGRTRMVMPGKYCDGNVEQEGSRIGAAHPRCTLRGQIAAFTSPATVTRLADRCGDVDAIYDGEHHERK